MSVTVLSGCGAGKEIASLQDEIARLKQSQLPRLEDCNVGYGFEVYPKVPFNYVVKASGSDTQDYTFHIESITATLIEKNTIKEGDTLDEPFYPYKVELRIKGNTDVALAGRSVGFSTVDHGGLVGTINEDGTFDNATIIRGQIDNKIIFFNAARI
jgi:hypothetical protein